VPIISTAVAAEKPSYVGFNEDQRIIWNTVFDKGPLQKYYEDAGYSEEVAEIIADADFEAFDWNEKVVAWKLYIADIKEEKEEKLYGEKYDRVKYIFSEYKTKDLNDPDAWKKVEENEAGTLFEPDEELYWHAVSLEYGVMLLLIPKKLNFGDIVDEVEDHIIDKYNLDKTNDASIDEVKVQYFLSKKSVGISTEFNYKDTDDTDSFESISKYTDDGILYYYEYMYGGDTIAKYELQGIFGAYFVENWWWIAIIGVAVIVVIVVIVIVVIKKRR